MFRLLTVALMSFSLALMNLRLGNKLRLIPLTSLKSQEEWVLATTVSMTK
jgi:hypothetical protein